jgi:hypothetical protein
MDYRLILSDFDQTLFRHDYKVHQSTIDTIKKYEEKGGRFAICTGRMLKSILPYAKSMNLSGDLVACQGSIIYSLDRDEFVLRGGIEYQLSKKILEYIEMKYQHIHMYIDGELYVNAYDEATKQYEQFCGVHANLINGKPSEFVLKNKYLLEKMLVFNRPEENESCYQDLLKKFGEIAVVSVSGEMLVEIADNNFSKGKALVYLAQRYNIPIEQTIAIGDSLNDLTMIKIAGKGIAVSNASDALKAAADEITISCDENAVEHIIKKYGLGEKI